MAVLDRNITELEKFNFKPKAICNALTFRTHEQNRQMAKLFYASHPDGTHRACMEGGLGTHYLFNHKLKW